MENQDRTESGRKGKVGMNAVSAADKIAASAKPKKSPKKNQKGWKDILFLISMLVMGGGSLWLLYWLYTKVVIWVAIGGIVGFGTLALGLIVFGGLKRGLATFALIFLICSVIWMVIWFLESPEYRAGIKAYDSGDWSAAIENFNRVIEKEPDHAEVYVKRCDALRRIGRPADALADCNQAIKRDYPYKDESYGARARVFAELGKPLQALNDFSVAIQTQPNAHDLLERGYLYNKIKKHQRALKDFKRALALDKDLVWAYWGMGNVWYDLNQPKAALKAYERYEKSGKKMSKAMKGRIALLRKQLNAVEK